LQISKRTYPKLKEVDDVLGGAEAWKNVDSTAGMASGSYWYHLLSDCVITSDFNNSEVCFLFHIDSALTLQFEQISFFLPENLRSEFSVAKPILHQ